MTTGPKSISKRFAVMNGERTVFLYLTRDLHMAHEELVVKPSVPVFEEKDRTKVMQLLVEAGITVRYFDEGERTWMDWSLSGGVTAAPGNKDGTWHTPSLDTFKKDYLRK